MMTRLQPLLLRARPISLALGLVVLVFAGARCGASSGSQRTTYMGFGSFGGPTNGVGGAPTTSFSGVVDPTNPAWAGPGLGGGMLACTASCSGATANRNRGALKAAIDYAASSSTPRTVYIPPGEYPIGCTSGQPYGVDFSGDNNVTISGWNVTLRFTGDQASADCSMFWIRNATHVKLEGLTFSERDVTNATASTNAIKIGDGGTTNTDDVSMKDVQWIEGVGGDFVRIDGGTTAATVTRVGFERCRLEGSARAAIDVRPGVQRLNVSYNFFRSNANRDIWIEDTGDGPIGQFVITGNMFETDKANPSVTLAGHGVVNNLDQSSFTFNRIIQVNGGASGGGTLEGSGLSRALIAYNTIITSRSASGPSLSLTGKVSDVWIEDNYIDRRGAANSAAVLKVASDGVSSPTNAIVRGNRVLQFSGSAPGIDMSGCTRCTVEDNNVTYHHATADSGATGFPGIYCAGAVTACSGLYARNRVKRDDQDIKASLNLATVTTNMNTVVEWQVFGTVGNAASLQFVGDSLTNVGSVTGSNPNYIIHYKPAGTTVSQAEALIRQTTIAIRTAGTGTNVLQVADAFGPTNLAGGVAAGRPLAGIQVMKGGGTTVGRLTLRDNFVDGARALIYMDGDGSSAYPDGYPIFGGNSSVSVTNETEGGITTYRSDTVTDAESVTNGAISPTKSVTFITTSGTVAYTYADPVRDGFVKTVRIKSAVSTPAGTLTPSHLADGTTHTITWGAGCASSPCAFDLVWDKTSGTNRVRNSVGVTIN